MPLSRQPYSSAHHKSTASKDTREDISLSTLMKPFQHSKHTSSIHSFASSTQPMINNNNSSSIVNSPANNNTNTNTTKSFTPNIYNQNTTTTTKINNSSTNNTPNSMSGNEGASIILSSDYARKMVFEQFEKIADQKMNLVLNTGVEIDLDLRMLLGEGVDPVFDKLIQSLAKLATTQQKSVIDAVMRWRKSKIEPLDLNFIKRLSEAAPLSRARDVQSILKERQSLASVYILCRTLIAIVKRFTPHALPDEQGENLEEIVFNQLKKADPETIRRSRNRTASMELFAELIGELSNIRFASVSDRFIAELEKDNNQTLMKERQSHMEMLIRGMRFLKIKIYPLDALEETADFLSSCASFFKNSHGIKVKHAYACLFVQLLLPVAEVAVAEVNFPAWAKMVDLIYPRAIKMTLKPKHITVAFPLVTTLLCVGRKEFFAQNWPSVLECCYQKFNKDKYTRQMALGCVSRIVWTYLFRCTESISTTFKKLDSIIKTIFPLYRRATYPTDVSLDHFILITYYALIKDVDNAMNNIIYYLLNMDNNLMQGGTTTATLGPSSNSTYAGSSAAVLHWEYLSPERMIIAIRAFQLLLTDLENNRQKPPFPVDTDMALTGLTSTFNSCSADVLGAPIRAIKVDATEKMEDTLTRTLLSLDQTFGKLLVLDEKNIIHRTMSSTIGLNTSSSINTSSSVAVMPTSSSSLAPHGSVMSSAPSTMVANPSSSTMVGSSSTGTNNGGGGYGASGLGSHSGSLISSHHHPYHSNSIVGENSGRSPSFLTTANNNNTSSYPVQVFGNTITGASGSNSSSVSNVTGLSDGSGPQVQYQYSLFAVSYSKDKQPYFDLLKTILDSMPRLMPSGIPLPRIVEMLSRYTVHIDPDIIQAASQTLRRIANQIDSQTVVTGYAKFVNKLEDKVSDIIVSLSRGVGTTMLSAGNNNVGNSSGNNSNNISNDNSTTNNNTNNSSNNNGSNSNMANDSEENNNFGGVLQLYVDLLAIWVEKVELGSLREIVMASPSPSLIEDVQSDVTRLFEMVEETEANGLMYLCSRSRIVRHMAIEMIQWAAKLEQRLEAQVEKETVVITTTFASSTSSSAKSDTVATQQFIQQLWGYIEQQKTRTFARLMNILESAAVGQELIQFDKDKNQLFGSKLSIETRLRLQQHQRKTTQPILIQLATSDNSTDQWIWHIIFMKLIDRIFTHFPDTVALCRHSICDRLVQIQPTLLASIETVKTGGTGTLSMAKSNTSNQKISASNDLIDQWKIYLAFACITATDSMIATNNINNNSNGNNNNNNNNRNRLSKLNAAAAVSAKVSDKRYPATGWIGGGRKGSTVTERLNSAHDLFKMVLPFLPCENRPIREGTIYGLGHIHPDSFNTLLHDLQPMIRTILDDGKHRTNQKPYQNKRIKKHDRLRTSLMHLLADTASCLTFNKSAITSTLKDNSNKNDLDREDISNKKKNNCFNHNGSTTGMELDSETKSIFSLIMSYIKETKAFLSDPEVQLEWEYHKLRVYLCRLVEQLYKVIMDLNDPTSIMSFETRLSLYKMFEEWCGYGAYANIARTRDDAMIHDVLEQCKDAKDRASMTKLMEEERKALESASLGAMAMLCRGPLYTFLGQKKARQAVIQFDMLNVLRWIDSVFESPDPKNHLIAKNALEALLIYNQDQALLLDDIIEQCYAGNPKLEFTQGYFQAVADIITSVNDYPCLPHQIICLALFKVGDAKKIIRKSAMQLLRVMEERTFGDSCAKEYEIGITSSLPAIYKHTQTLLSARLSVDHPEQTYNILSEITQRFEHISPNSQREVLVYMLPWFRKVELSMVPIGSNPSSNSSTVASLPPTHNQEMELSSMAYIVLSNLYYITIKFGDIYVKEIAALWNQLVDYGRNVRPIITYLLDMGLEKRNPWFLVHAKRVFVCLGRTPAFTHVVEEAISEITPRSMVPQVKEPSHQPNRHHGMFVADTEKVLPPYAKRPAFSRGQLAMVYLVDLAIETGADLAPHLPLLLHAIFVQLDHLTSIICDQSRCLLINLIHAIIVRQSMNPEISALGMEIIQWLTAKEGKRLWAYENIIPNKNRRLQSSQELEDLVQRILLVFSHEDPDLRQKWGETALKWATYCSVRHIACRSFQCFRGLLPAFNQHMLADMLARLSTTIADKSEDIRGFSLEIILTLTKVARAMDANQLEQFPQLFWAAVACLFSPFSSEHLESLVLLETILLKVPPSSTEILTSSFPVNWSSEFDGLQPLLLKGLQFSLAEEKTWVILRNIMLLDNSPLIDPAPTRFMYLLLGAVPRLLHGLDQQNESANAQKQQSNLLDDITAQNNSNGNSNNLLNDESPTTDIYLNAVELASDLCKLAEKVGLTDVQRVLTTYPKQKAKFQMDYLKQLVGTLRNVYLMDQGHEALMFALLMINNTLDYYQDKTLMLIEVLIPHVLQSQSCNKIELNTLTPLLQLIQTQYADRALALLNTGISTIGNSYSDSPNMASSSSSSPATSATNPRLSSSIPVWRMDENISAAITRKNIQAVVFECSSITNRAPIEHNIQFSIEDFSLLTGDQKMTAAKAVASGVMTTLPIQRTGSSNVNNDSNNNNNSNSNNKGTHTSQQFLSTKTPSLLSSTPSPLPSPNLIPTHLDVESSTNTITSDISSATPTIISSSTLSSTSSTTTTVVNKSMNDYNNNNNNLPPQQHFTSVPREIMNIPSIDIDLSSDNNNNNNNNNSNINYDNNNNNNNSNNLVAPSITVATAGIPQHGEELMNALKDLDDFFNEETEGVPSSSDSLASFQQMGYDYTNNNA